MFILILIFVFFGLLSILMKGYRLIFMVLSLEMIMMGMFMYICPLISEVLFFLLLTFSLISSVLSLLMLVNLMTCYGNDYVVF